MKRILVPTDFSDLSAKAVDFALKLSKKVAGEVHLVHVVENPIQVDEAGYEIPELEVKNAQSLMEQFLQKFEKQPAVSKVLLGKLRKDIKVYIQKQNIDFVVMATRGVEGLKEVFVGSHAEKVVRHSPVPTLVIKKDIPDPSTIQNIAFAGDFEREQNTDIQPVLRLQELLGAKLHFIEICPPERGQSCQEVLDSMKRFAQLHKVRDAAFHVFESYNIIDGLGEFAQSNRIDLIAMGTHQRTGLKRWLQASIAEEVVNHAEEAVLTFHMD